MPSDAAYMERCLELALKGLGRVSPNPLVGCVIVLDDKIIGEGYHHNFGGAHAEVNAIAAVKDPKLLSRATLYANLEPCAHYGKTPPCANLIVEKQLARVVIGTPDPYPKVAGLGIRMMEKAGIQLTTGILSRECSMLNRRFFTFHTLKRPYIILKWATSSDGYLSPGKHLPENRERWWITGSLANTFTHKWRSEEDSILAGMNTIISDNPGLNNRKWSGRTPLRVVIDPDLALNDSYQVVDEAAPTLVLNHRLNKMLGRKEWQRIAPDGDRVDETLKVLYQKGIQSLIVEGGAETLNAYLDAGMWDEARVWSGKKAFGKGVRAPELSVPPASQAQIGEDLLHLYFNKNNPMLPAQTA
jgi:diaminohydroxyphosphoribosylaminopyrimidine deaminase/5-amino-6-(5-phosphoribosylamino)uracil reductase